MRLYDLAASIYLLLNVRDKKHLSVSKFNEFKPCLKSPKNRFQLSAGLNLEKCNTILSDTNQI